MQDPAPGTISDPATGVTPATQQDAAVPAGFGALDEWINELIPSKPLQVLAVIAIAIVLAKVTEWILCSFLRGWTRRTKIDIDDQIIALLHGPVFKTVVILGIGSATYRIDLDAGVQRVTQRALWTIMLFLWTVFAFRFVSLLVSSAAAKPDRFRSIEDRTFPLFDNLAKIGVAGIAIYLVITVWNIDPAGWLASAGIVGIAVGFAAKDTLANLITGVFIIADAPYKVGDFVNLSDGTRGQVSHIGLRSTRLITRDDIEVTIPNAVIGSTQIINETGGPSPRYRIRVKVGAAYGSDIDDVRRVLLEVAASESRVVEDPEPRVRFRRFGDSALEFELLCWIPEPVLRGRVLDALNTAVYKRFADAGIEIAYPKRDIYIRQMPTGFGGG